MELSEDIPSMVGSRFSHLVIYHSRDSDSSLMPRYDLILRFSDGRNVVHLHIRHDGNGLSA